MKSPLPPIVLLALLLCVVSAGAETHYVSDQTRIMLRAGEGPRYKILRGLPAGSPVEVLSVNKKTGYARVRTKNGKTGYVLTRQLMKEPAARAQLAEMRQRLAELEGDPQQLTARLSAAQRENARLRAENAQLQQERDTLAHEYEALQRLSADSVRISKERTELRRQQVSLLQQIGELKQENLELSNTAAQKWLLNGALVTLGGILIGLILPRLRGPRRKDSWGKL